MASSTTHYVLVFFVVAFVVVQAWPQQKDDRDSSRLQNRRGPPGGPGGRPNSFGEGGRPNSFGERDDFDNVPSATGHHGHHTGRVQIKVYRGQTKGHGWDSFAPYGYWVRQPPDNHGHHHGY